MNKILWFVWSKWFNIGVGFVLALYFTCDAFLPFSVIDEAIDFRLPPNTKVVLLDVKGDGAAMWEEPIGWKAFTEKVNSSGGALKIIYVWKDAGASAMRGFYSDNGSHIFFSETVVFERGMRYISGMEVVGGRIILLPRLSYIFIFNVFLFSWAIGAILMHLTMIVEMKIWGKIDPDLKL